MSIGKYIDKMGIEIEAGWKRKRTDLIEDVSIKKEAFSVSKSIGEFVSQPFKNKEGLFQSLKENWGDETTERCSFHLHLSFKNLMFYSQCMSFSFYSFFLEEMEKWGKNYPCRNELFWQRLKGDNKYCTRSFHPETQIIGKVKKHNDENRYTHLNYCYGVYETIECRLFPTFCDVDTAISATKALINCVEVYLEKNPFKEVIIDELIDNVDEDSCDELKLIPFNLFKIDKNVVPKANKWPNYYLPKIEFIEDKSF
jgi:hypothetical protein